MKPMTETKGRKKPHESNMQVSTNCPQCGFPNLVYLQDSFKDDDKVEKHFFCKNCDHKWVEEEDIEKEEELPDQTETTSFLTSDEARGRYV